MQATVQRIKKDVAMVGGVTNHGVRERMDGLACFGSQGN